MSTPPSNAGEQQAPSQPLRDVLFARFSEETDPKSIFKTFNELCAEIGLEPAQYEGFYQAFKGSFTSWKSAALFQLLDGRAKQTEYRQQQQASGGAVGVSDERIGAAYGKHVLVVGAGPVGLRAAVEAAFLGAKVDLVEKRDSFTRNNSLHLWPFLITDLKNLGAKKFYGRFCSSTIDHISIRILQGILLKVCLILGVKVHLGVTFVRLIEPTNANSGWTVATTPTSSPVTSHHFDMIVGADGKQNSLPGFHSKEFRAKLALAITANYVNSFTKQESSVPEISGVSYVYRQNFFDDLSSKFGIELENIVYYKDETHYFVMTAKKSSLLLKGVLKKDHSDPANLLHKDNIDKKSLERYTNEAVTYSTEGALGSLPFEKNHRGENDVALFDFTSLFASENAARIVERKGKRILLCLVGDSLLEPFWPTGTGAARGFLSVFDAMWMMKRFCAGDDPLEVLEERESILYLLPQTTPERLQKNHASYSIDPKTRYISLSEVIPPGDISHLYDTDNSNALQLSRNQSMARSSTKTRATRASPVSAEVRAAGHGPTHSQSIDELASILSASSADKKTDKDSISTTTSAGKHGKQSTGREEVSSEKESPANKGNIKHFWQRKQESSVAKPAAGKSKDSAGEDVKAKTSKKVEKSPNQKKAEANQKKAEANQKKAEANQKKEESSQKKAESSQKKAELVQKKVNPKTEALLTQKKAESPKPKKVESMSQESKLFRIQNKGQERSKSASPERSTGRKDHRGAQGDEKQEASGGEETQINVLDRIKDYNIRDSAVQQAAAAGGGKTKTTTIQSQDVQAKGKPAKGDKAKRKEEVRSKVKEGRSKVKTADKEKKIKDKDGDKKKQDKKAAKKDHWRLFKKHKTTDGSKDGGKKGKKSHDEKKTEKKTDPQQPSAKEASAQMFPGVKNRIDKLRELGLETDGDVTDDGVILLSMQQQGEGEGEGEGSMQPDIEEEESGDSSSTTSEWTSDSERDYIDGEDKEDEIIFDESDTEDRLLSPEAKASSLEDLTSPVESSQQQDAPPTAVVADGGDGDEAGVSETASERNVKDTVRILQERQTSMESRHRPRSFTDTKRSKEIDLSELSQLSRPKESHPLWKARIIQGMNNCLEKLRKENDIKVSKTTLEIVYAIFSNVEKYPDNDVFRRVRVSSQEFTSQVWQYSEARQFLARSGWVQIDDVIVLPMDSAVDTPKRVIEKHLSIVNNKLWSMQLEIPASHGTVVVRQRPQGKPRGRVFSLNRRESYASRLVEESMEKISEEEDRMEMAAARVRMNSAGAERGVSPSDTDGTDDTDGGGGLPTLQENEEETETVTATQANVPTQKLEEVQTIKAATAARKKWEAMNDKTEELQKQTLETALYGLPPSKLAESIATERRYEPSSYRRELSTAAPGIEDRIRMLSIEGKAGGGTTQNSTSPLEAEKLTGRVEEEEEEEEEEEGKIGEIAAAEPMDKEQLIPFDSPPDEDKYAISSLAKETAQPSSLEDETTLTNTTTTTTASSTSATSASTSPISVSPTDQDTTTSIPVSSTVTSHKEGMAGDSLARSYGNGTDQLKLLTAASWSRNSDKRDVSPARSERNDYEKLTMEAAALSREKWKQSEEQTGKNYS